MQLHEASYLTLLSIVQGVAMGFLGARMPTDLSSGALLLFLATFMFVILVWAEYNMGVATLSWIPTFRDALIPFALCMAEILLTNFFNAPRLWFLTASLFSVIGFFAFVNMYDRAQRYDENKTMLHVLGVWKSAGKAFCLAAAAIFAALALTRCEGYVAASLAIVVAALFAIRTQCAWRRVVVYARQARLKMT